MELEHGMLAKRGAGKIKVMNPFDVDIAALGVNEIVTVTVFAKMRSALEMVIEKLDT